jgi:phosphate:Na+ symporter
MVAWGVLFSIVPALILFFYGIENFTREILRVAKGDFARILGRLTTRPVVGAFIGAIVTAIVQSSAATTVITVGLVDAGIISFMQSLGVIIGSNIGTTITAQLVAFQVMSFGPVFILVGFVLDLVGGRYKFLGKPIFYFGLVFFSLNLLSTTLATFQNDPAIVAMLSEFSTPLLAILVGLLFTVLVQSSSVTTGIVVVLSLNGLISLEHAIFLLFGANIGSTTTSLLGSSRMGLFARRSAVAHLIFNVGGVLLILPFFDLFVSLVVAIGGTEAQQVANAHLLFNLINAVIFLVLIRQFQLLVTRVVPGEEKEILLKTKYLGDELPEETEEGFESIELELGHSLDVTHDLFRASMGVLDGAKTKDLQRITKLKTLNDFLNRRIEEAIRDISRRKLSDRDARRTVLFVRISNILERLGDWGSDLGESQEKFAVRNGGIPPHVHDEIACAYAMFEQNLLVLRRAFPGVLPDTTALIKQNDNELREILNTNYQAHLNRIAQKNGHSESLVVEVLSVIEEANGDIHILRKLCEMYGKVGLNLPQVKENGKGDLSE